MRSRARRKAGAKACGPKEAPERNFSHNLLQNFLTIMAVNETRASGKIVRFP